MSAPVGLIAGCGRFPHELARLAAGRGHRVFAFGLAGLVEPGLESEAETFCEVPLGQLAHLFGLLHEAGVKQVVMAGKVPKSFLYQNADRLQPDARALELLGSLADRSDDSILGIFAEALAEEGFELLGQAELAPELWAPEGPIAGPPPSPDQLADASFAWPIAKALGHVDVGQTVVVENRAVLALEAIEGTDEAIRRGCALGRGGALVVKVAKPEQDLRFDVPAIGRDTIEVLARGGAGALAVEAGHVLLLDRADLEQAAEEAAIAVFGMARP
ncbi:MAG: LpxI family protein [Myxococcota bacterium]